MPPSVYLCAAGIDTLHFKQQTLRNRPFKLGFKLPQIDKALFLTLPMSLRVSAEAWPTQEWQSAGLDYWEDHMPLSTPAGCVGGGLASPRIGPENLSPGSQAGLDSGVVKRQHNTASEKTYQMPFSDLFFMASLDKKHDKEKKKGDIFPYQIRSSNIFFKVKYHTDLFYHVFLPLSKLLNII